MTLYPKGGLQIYMEERLAKLLAGPRNPNPVTLTEKFGVIHPYRSRSSSSGVIIGACFIEAPTPSLRNCLATDLQTPDNSKKCGSF